MIDPKGVNCKVNHRDLYVYFIILIGYLFIGIFLLSIFKYHINTDAPSYIAIAEKYASGNFRDAVNGYWSPLISWLLVPLIMLDVDPLYAFKLIGLITGIFGLIIIKNLLLDFSISEKISITIIISLIPAFYAFTLITVNPDFMVAIILLVYVRKILSENYGSKKNDGVICGLLGAIAYFAKGFAFPFFISHFAVINLCRYYSSEEGSYRKQIKSCFIFGMVTFFFFSSFWISSISIKEKRLIFNKAGTYNLNLVNNSWIIPLEQCGFLQPPDPIALSFWDDPSLIPFQSKAGVDEKKKLNLMASNLIRNLLHTIDVLQAGSVFSIAIITFSILYLMRFSKREWIRNRIFLVLVTMGMYTSGYLPLLITKRYIYLDIFLLFILGNYFVYQHDFHEKTQKAFAICCLCISFMFMPIRDLYANASSGRNIHNFSIELKKFGISGQIASNGHLDDSIFASYHLRIKYLGFAKSGICDAELISEFVRYKIDYYFCWQDKQCNGILSIYPEITKGRFNHLRIYKIRQESSEISS